MTKTTTTLRSSKQFFEPDQLASALMIADELLERCQFNYFLLDDLAWQVYKNYQFLENLEELTFGITRTNWTKLSRSLIQSVGIKNLEIDTDAIEFKCNGVPVVVWIINKNYEFFKRPDMKWYLYSEFKLPNPFMKYWKVRYLIK